RGVGPFDRLARLAVRMVGAPVALVSLVGEGRPVLASREGLPGPWTSPRETPLASAFGRLVVESRRPLVLEDARRHPLASGTPAVDDPGVAAFLGIPLIGRDGRAIGSLCAIDLAPRAWGADDVAAMRDLAASALAEVELLSEISERDRSEREGGRRF